MGPFSDPSAKILIERVSRCSLSRHENVQTLHLEPKDVAEATPKDPFTALRSPYCTEQPTPCELEKAKDVDDNRVVNIWDRRWFGLVLHSVAIGIVSTVLPLSVYPFLTCNLNMEGTQTLSARTLLGLPWALKPIFSMFIQCFPFPSGFRYRFVMHLGWLVTAAALLAIFFHDQPPPYFQDREMVGTPLDELSSQDMSTINLEAPSHGAFYVMMMSVASVGYVLADVAADELIRDIGLQHFGRLDTPLNEQDEVLQTVMTKYRVIATLACFLFMGVAMSGWDYGGDFDFTLEYTQVMLTVGLVAVVPVLFLSFTSCESACERHSLRQSLRETWAVLNDCRLNYVLCCRFVGGICAGVSATAVNPIAFYYAGVQPLNDTVVSFVAILLVLCALKWVSTKGWDVDYRAVIVAGTVATLALDLGATMFTIWNVVRSQWLWIGLPVMEAIPSALDYTITTVILTEIADPKAHAAVSGLVMSVSFVASPMGLVVSKYIDAQFDVTNQDIMTDTTDVRTQIMGTFFVAYATQLLALLWLLALPKNASESQSMEAGGSTSTGRAVLFLALLSASFLIVVAVHALSVYAPTACLAIAGGKGC